jgi:hypothetical protein
MQVIYRYMPICSTIVVSVCSEKSQGFRNNPSLFRFSDVHVVDAFVWDLLSIIASPYMKAKSASLFTNIYIFFVFLLSINACVIWSFVSLNFLVFSLSRKKVECIYNRATELSCRNADAGQRQLPTGRNADAGLTFLCHSGIYIWFFSVVYSYSIPSAPVKRRAGCIPFHQQQYGRAWCIPVVRIRDPVPFWPLDPGSRIGFFRIPDPKPIFLRVYWHFFG